MHRRFVCVCVYVRLYTRRRYDEVQDAHRETHIHSQSRLMTCVSFLASTKRLNHAMNYKRKGTFVKYYILLYILLGDVAL